MRAGQHQAEAGASSGNRDVVQPRLVGPAQLAGDIQAQPGAMLGRGEERPECPDREQHPGQKTDHHHRNVITHAH